MIKLIDKVLGKHQENQHEDNPPASNLVRVALSIKGMDCRVCASNIEHALKREIGVMSAKVDHSKGIGVIIYDPSRTSEDKIRYSTVFREPSMFSVEAAEENGS